MLKTERMTRVLVMGSMDALEETVDYLYDSRSFHVIDFKKDEVHDIGAPLPGADAASAKLLKMMSVSSSLGIAGDESPRPSPMRADKVERQLDAALAHLELEISGETHARKAMEDLLSMKRADLAAITPFQGIQFGLGKLAGYSSMAVLSGRVKGDPEPEISHLTDAYEVLSRGDVFILAVDRQHEEQAAKVLASHGFVETKLPGTDERPADAMARLKAEIASLEKKLRKVNTRLKRLKARNARFVKAALENLTIEANKAEAPLRFGTARHTFLIDAWVPTKAARKLRAGLNRVRSGVVDMVPLKAEDGQEPPIMMSNPKAVTPMQMLLEMFSLPSYDEIDPAAFMFITFPLFYGLMLGDIGYGLVILALVLSGGLAKLMTKLGMGGGAPGLSKILLYCSMSSILFGFIFDETFGFELLPHSFSFEMFGVHFPVHRGDTEMVGEMLIFCVLIGVAHLMLGYVAGLRNAWVKHGAKHAILEKGGWCLILAGLTMFAFSAMPRLISGGGLQFTDPQSLIGLGILAAGVVMAFAVEGINTILELPGLTGNLLSYTRIYAIGLSSVGIAMAFNEYMAIPALEAGGIGIVIGVLVLVAGHALNIGLGVIGPLIQTLRLHYVEFFTKFYKGGGVKFNPLKYDRKHTKEV